MCLMKKCYEYFDNLFRIASKQIDGKTLIEVGWGVEMWYVLAPQNCKSFMGFILFCNGLFDR